MKVRQPQRSGQSATTSSSDVDISTITNRSRHFSKNKHDLLARFGLACVDDPTAFEGLVGYANAGTRILIEGNVRTILRTAKFYPERRTMIDIIEMCELILMDYQRYPRHGFSTLFLNPRSDGLEGIFLGIRR